MSILLHKSSRVICQGFTGKQGTFHSEQCIAYGTKLVGGVTPGRSGQRHLGLPVFDTAEQAVNARGDPVRGMNFVDVLALFEEDPGTDGIIMVGEIGGADEEAAAAFIRRHVAKPVVAYIAGVTAPPGKRMGHAGAVIAGGKGTASDKFAALEAAGVNTVHSPAELGSAMLKALKRRRANPAARRATRRRRQ